MQNDTIQAITYGMYLVYGNMDQGNVFRERYNFQYITLVLLQHQSHLSKKFSFQQI